MNASTERKPVVVLGGSGFVGRHLSARLVEAGWPVKVLTRYRPDSRELWVLPGLTVHTCDVYDSEALQQHFEGGAAVVNLVGILNERGRSGKGFHRAHVTLTETILEAMQAVGVSRYLHMSALNAGRGKSHYLKSKGEAEQRVFDAATSGKIAPTVFRPSVIFAPDDSFFNRFAGLLRLAPLGFPLACARARFQPVWVGDVVEAFVRSLEREQTIGQTYELGGPREYRLDDIVAMTARWNGWRRKAWPIPDALARLQGLAFDFSPIKPFSSDNYHSLQLPSVVEGEDGLSALDIEPRTVESIMPAHFGASDAAH